MDHSYAICLMGIDGDICGGKDDPKERLTCLRETLLPIGGDSRLEGRLCWRALSLLFESIYLCIYPSIQTNIQNSGFHDTFVHVYHCTLLIFNSLLHDLVSLAPLLYFWL